MSLETTHFYSGYRSGSLSIMNISHTTPMPAIPSSTATTSVSDSVLTCITV